MKDWVEKIPWTRELAGLVEPTNILILGAGEKATKYHTILSPMGKVVCVDRRKLPGVDIVVDLESQDWAAMIRGILVCDIIVAEHLAEHLANRIAFLQNCHWLLRDRKGLLILEVPNWCHVLAHGNLEHKSTWSRMSFHSYVTADLFTVERIQYRWTNPITFRNHYFPTEWLGRQVDRCTRQVSGLRFYLRAK